MIEPIEFDTERLRLRQWTDADREPFAALNADPRVMEHFPATLNRESSDAMADRVRAHIAQHGWGLWAAELRGAGEFIGFVGLSHAPAALAFAPAVEVGWRLAAAYWGRGYATEAARGALAVAFERLGLAEVVSFTALTNTRSRAVMERLGMIAEADTFEHPNVPEGHVLREHCLYRISYDQWRNLS